MVVFFDDFFFLCIYGLLFVSLYCIKFCCLCYKIFWFIINLLCGDLIRVIDDMSLFFLEFLIKFFIVKYI